MGARPTSFAGKGPRLKADSARGQPRRAVPGGWTGSRLREYGEDGSEGVAAMFKKALLVIVALVAVLAVVIALQPSTYRVARSTTIAAPPEAVFAQVNDFHAWNAWSPWARLDPHVKNTFEGPAAGTGAIFKWEGNAKVGQGAMTLTDSHAPDRIRIKLEFLKPFASTCDTGFDFAAADKGTRVTWTMSGTCGFLDKAFCLFMGGMDRMVGPDFERGLAQMKAIAEQDRPAEKGS